MRSSIAETHAAVRAIAVELAGEPIGTIEMLARTGNNRIYRVRGERRAYALKRYPLTERGRAALARESTSMGFLQMPAAGRIPAIYGVDAEAGYALYEWIDGTPIDRPDAGEIDMVLDFIALLRTASGRDGAHALGPASEAYTTLPALTGAIRGRIERLRGSAGEERALRGFLDVFEPILTTVEQRARHVGSAAGIDVDLAVGIAQRTLSPSDLSFHNALRRAGTLVFFDFEHFGWDDPVKLVADFVWHPAMALADAPARRFVAGACALFGSRDHAFAARLRATFALFGLKWCAIMLNEFSADDWKRRQFAGESQTRAAVLDRQLRKARAHLDAVISQEKESMLWS